MPTRCAAQTAAHPVCDKSSTQGCPTAGIPKYLPARGLLLSTPPEHSSWTATWVPTWIQTRTTPQDRGQGATRGDSNLRRAAKSGALCSRHLGIRQPGRKRLAEEPPSPRTVHACDWPEGPSCETVPSGPEIAHRKPCWATPISLPLPLPLPLPPCLPASLPPCLPASLPHCLTALTAPGRAAPSPCTAPSYSRAPDWGQDWALTYVNWALTDAREVALTLPRLSGA